MKTIIAYEWINTRTGVTTLVYAHIPDWMMGPEWEKLRAVYAGT